MQTMRERQFIEAHLATAVEQVRAARDAEIGQPVCSNCGHLVQFAPPALYDARLLQWIHQAAQADEELRKLVSRLALPPPAPETANPVASATQLPALEEGGEK